MTPCTTCGLTFPVPWCKTDVCIFCTRYMPMRETRLQMLGDARNCYLMSGWWDEAAYSRLHVQHLRVWCGRWYIPETPQEAVATAALLKHQNWTREVW